MGWFREMLSGQQALQESQERRDRLAADLNEARRERQEAVNEQYACRDRMKTQQAENERLHRELAKVTLLSERYYAEKHLMVQMLEDARQRELRHGDLTARVITVERHNATAEASNQWAIAHINILTTERATLLSQRGVTVPSPSLGWADPDPVAPRQTRGAPAQPFDTMDAPPPGPIATQASIAGTPIPDGQTAGDVLARLRERKESVASQGNVSPEDLLRAGADLFDDLAFTPPGDPSPASPFTE